VARGENLPVLEVPAAVRAKALAAGAERWLDALPALVAELEGEWSIRMGRVLEGGTEALVAEAALEEGPTAVLKLMAPGDDAAVRCEITALRLCAGDGCAALLRSDPARGALLLERLGPPLSELGLPAADRHEILCSTARRVWRPAPGEALPTGLEKARRLAAFITTSWEELRRPCAATAVAYALECAGRRAAAYDPGRAVLVHGDVHQWNALQASDGSFKLVDPDGLLAEPEYDLGIIMREDPVELMQGDPMARAQRLAARAGLDAQAIWEWGVVERVSTGLLATKVGLQPVAGQMLQAAELVATRG
jgi:streptomycin 6-kinase